MSSSLSIHPPSMNPMLVQIDGTEFLQVMEKLLNGLWAGKTGKDFAAPPVRVKFSELEASEVDPVTSVLAPLSDRLPLGFKEAASLLSMTEQALRDLVHKGQGPETVKRGKRVCFTHEGLRSYVDRLPKECPYQGIIETLFADCAKPMSIEEQRVFGI